MYLYYTTTTEFYTGTVYTGTRKVKVSYCTVPGTVPGKINLVLVLGMALAWCGYPVPYPGTRYLVYMKHAWYMTSSFVISVTYKPGT